MIKLTKLNNEILYLNPHLIEKIEEKPDTIITMDSQVQYIVKDRIGEITEQIISYRRKIAVPGQNE